MGVGFDNTCIVSGKRNISRVIPRLYGRVYKTLRLSPLVVEHSAVVMNAISQSRRLPDWILWVANFRFPFYKTCVQNQWGHKILRPSWGTQGLICFQFWYCELRVENRWGGGRKHFLKNFCFSAVLLLSMDVEWCVGQTVLFRASWHCLFFQPGFQTKQWAWHILTCCTN